MDPIKWYKVITYLEVCEFELYEDALEYYLQVDDSYARIRLYTSIDITPEGE